MRDIQTDVMHAMDMKGHEHLQCIIIRRELLNIIKKRKMKYVDHVMRNKGYELFRFSIEEKICAGWHHSFNIFQKGMFFLHNIVTVLWEDKIFVDLSFLQVAIWNK